MAEPERTDQEIDDAIRQWQLRLRDVPDALGVSRERVQERWEWFRREVYRWIAEGRSTAEIVAEVGLPTSAIAAFRARWTHGYRPEGLVGPEPPPEPDDAPGGEEIEEAVVTTFGLERDLQRTLRETIAQLKPDLKIIDEGREHRSAAGQIDILCDGGDGASWSSIWRRAWPRTRRWVRIKREMTADGPYADQPARGVMVAKDFSKRMRHASSALPNLRLESYAIHFTFQDRSSAWPGSTPPALPFVNDSGAGCRVMVGIRRRARKEARGPAPPCARLSTIG
jgi:hypothetical protein